MTRTTCIVQARMGSSRLPGKVLMDLGGRPMLVFLLERLSCLEVNSLVVATSGLPEDDAVAEAASGAGASVVRGPAEDVLARYALALQRHPAQTAIRLTADCPLSDPQIIGAALRQHAATRATYTSNTLIRTFPDGLDVEVIDAGALLLAARESTDPVEREHVTPFVYRRPELFRLGALRGDQALGGERWTVDTAEDIAFVRTIVAALAPRSDFGWHEALAVAGRRDQPEPGRVTLRPVMAGDGDFLLALRNDPAAVRFSQTGRAVDPAEHESWFRARLGDPARRIWIGEVDAVPVGQVRVDVTGGIGEVSLAIEVGQRGRGYGSALLGALQMALRFDHQVVGLIARIHRANQASLATFQAVGFALQDGSGEFVTLYRRRGSDGA